METEMLRLHTAGILRTNILEEGNLSEVDHSLSIYGELDETETIEEKRTDYKALNINSSS